MIVKITMIIEKGMRIRFFTGFKVFRDLKKEDIF
jgi:hypothetical protein